MSDSRKEFEALPKVAEIISNHSDELAFNEDVNIYETPIYENWIPEFLYEINFGWYAFQGKQKQVDAIRNILSDELEYDEVLIEKIKELLK